METKTLSVSVLFFVTKSISSISFSVYNGPVYLTGGGRGGGKRGGRGGGKKGKKSHALNNQRRAGKFRKEQR